MDVRLLCDVSYDIFDKRGEIYQLVNPEVQPQVNGTEVKRHGRKESPEYEQGGVL